MALRVIETEDARYYLGLGNHYSSSEGIFRDVDFSRLDFMVFEDTGYTDGLAQRINNHPQYADVYARIIREHPRLAIYGVDVPPWKSIYPFNRYLHSTLLGLTSFLGVSSGAQLWKKRKNLNRREFLKHAGVVAFGFRLPNIIASGFLNSGEQEHLPLSTDYNSFLSNLVPLPGDGLRDAVAAKKISQYLVPKHQRESGKKKVQCAILYGIGHSGMETKLRHLWIADATLYFYRHILRPASGEELNQVRWVVSEDWGRRRTHYSSCDLF